MNRTAQKELGWPAAATIIAAMIGAVAASITLAIAPHSDSGSTSVNRLATAREIGEVKARLKAIETTSHQMRRELRDDIKELRKLIQTSLEANRSS